jgi:hypothetical protein
MYRNTFQLSKASSFEQGPAVVRELSSWLQEVSTCRQLWNLHILPLLTHRLPETYHVDGDIGTFLFYHRISAWTIELRLFTSVAPGAVVPDLTQLYMELGPMKPQLKPTQDGGVSWPLGYKDVVVGP